MRRLVSLFGLLAIALLLVVTLALRSAASAAREKREQVSRDLQRDFDDCRGQIEADEAEWAAHPLFGPHDGGDVSLLLARHLGWDPSADAGLPAPDEPLPAGVAALLNASRDGGWVHLRDEEILEVDTAWLAELESFGFWDTETSAGLGDRPFDGFNEILPNYVATQQFAKVRLIQGLADGGVVLASHQVRQLARLVLSNETLVAGMVGTALLGLEHQAWEAAKTRGLEFTGWRPITPDEVNRIRALMWVAPAVMGPLATGSLAGHRLVIGECIGLREGLGAGHALRQYLEPELPARYAELTTALKASRCRLRRLRAVWAANSPEGQFPATTRAWCTAVPEQPCTLPEVPLSLIPFSRGFVGNTLASIATTDWFRLYRVRQ